MFIYNFLYYVILKHITEHEGVFYVSKVQINIDDGDDDNEECIHTHIHTCVCECYADLPDSWNWSSL